ncbi:hypothetical protein GGTG_04456 [Gaeumannomyces tritici R3-111a-1]|uniref:Uncharacterized protein n=1 Tax=Gaeumannomyces tritici (strain R3-111a-1) TaxID=644352 RepID=J3NT58_GAET3|nr:hypothetical protein GGTG_04456 [Gaeumannomyces tritici R3-111a-1]EJT79372.1 hypothetical protein GGTG_04456 [Gaeumannomyces tritici R3-111a-1]
MAFSKLTRVYISTRFSSKYRELIALEKRREKEEDVYIREWAENVDAFNTLCLTVTHPDEYIMGLSGDVSPQEHALIMGMMRDSSSPPILCEYTSCGDCRAMVRRSCLSKQLRGLFRLLLHCTLAYQRLMAASYLILAARLEAKAAEDALTNSVSVLGFGRGRANKHMQDILGLLGRPSHKTSQAQISRDLEKTAALLRDVEVAIGPLMQRIMTQAEHSHVIVTSSAQDAEPTMGSERVSSKTPLGLKRLSGLRKPHLEKATAMASK